MRQLDNLNEIDFIYQYSRYYGSILYECEELYKEERGISLIILFFFTVENIIKSINENFDDKFFESINKNAHILSKEELDYLHRIREIRNYYVHDDLSSCFFVWQDIAYNFQEDTTALILYEDVSKMIYNILIKLINNKKKCKK